MLRMHSMLLVGTLLAADRFAFAQVLHGHLGKDEVTVRVGFSQHQCSRIMSVGFAEGAKPVEHLPPVSEVPGWRTLLRISYGCVWINSVSKFFPPLPVEFRFHRYPIGVFSRWRVGNESSRRSKGIELPGENPTAEELLAFVKSAEKAAQFSRAMEFSRGVRLMYDLHNSHKFMPKKPPGAVYDYLPVSSVACLYFVLSESRMHVVRHDGTFDEETSEWTGKQRVTETVNMPFQEPFLVFADGPQFFTYYFLTDSGKVYKAVKTGDAPRTLELIWNNDRPVTVALTDIGDPKAGNGPTWLFGKDFLFKLEPTLKPIAFDKLPQRPDIENATLRTVVEHAILLNEKRK